MANVARIFHERQTLMLTPVEQSRLQIEPDAVQAIAAWVLQHQKGSRTMRLAHLRDEDERAVFLADAMELLSPERRQERQARLNALRAQGHANRENEEETVKARARADIAFFGDPLVAAFMTTNPKYCAVCKDLLITNAVDVLVTPHLKGRAHGLCCAKNEVRFVFVNEFTYQLLEANRG